MLRFRLHSLEILRRLPSSAMAALPDDLVLERIEPGDTTSEESQDDSRVAADRIRGRVEGQGVRFLDTDAALRAHGETLRKYFGSVGSSGDDPLGALNGAAWGGGSFVYVPPGVHVDFPLQADMLENARKVGPFERTLVIADEGAHVEFIDGCTSPLYPSQSLSAAVVEVVALPGSRVRYIEFQNWTKEVSNLVLKRAHAHRGATVEWLDANIGSRVTRNAPEVRLLGPDARAEVVGISLAGADRRYEVGAHVAHEAPHTSSHIECRSAVQGGAATHRLSVSVAPGATGARSSVRWSALLLDGRSRCLTFPSVEIDEADAAVAQEGSAEKISEETLFYVMSRGFSRAEAVNLLVLGLLDVFLKRIPMEYAVEFNRLIALELEGAVG